MISKRLRQAVALTTVFTLGWAPAMAQELVSPVQVSPEQDAPVPVAPAIAETPDSPFGGVVVVDALQLGTITGQADIGQVIQAENNSTVSHNSVSGNSVTGTINFDPQSFQNMNGLSVLSANTGNNVAINASLNVNVSIQQ